MAPKIFVLGATGYIGGDALYEIVSRHPEYEIACLVRNSNAGVLVASQYPKVRLVYGNLDNVKILEDEARKADIVLNFANADHETAVSTLVSNLSEGSRYLIHTGGTGILTVKDLDCDTFGETSLEIYDDWEGVGQVTSLPDHAPHRKVDKIIIAAGCESPSTIKTAIVCPPTIYGRGRGPGNQRGYQVYELSRCTLEKGKGFQVGAGKAYWANVHIYDLSRCYLKLVEAAASHDEMVTWGREGYYFVENGEHRWGEVAKAVASAAQTQGIIPSNEVVMVSSKEADQLSPYGSLLWGSNSRCRAIRSRKLLGWSPEERSLEEEIPDIIRSEAKRLGIVQGHAAHVAG